MVLDFLPLASASNPIQQTSSTCRIKLLGTYHLTLNPNYNQALASPPPRPFLSANLRAQLTQRKAPKNTMFPKSTTLLLVGLAIVMAGPAAAAPGSPNHTLEARDIWKSDVDVKEACKQQYGGTGEVWVAEVVGPWCDD